MASRNSEVGYLAAKLWYCVHRFWKSVFHEFVFVLTNIFNHSHNFLNISSSLELGNKQTFWEGIQNDWDPIFRMEMFEFLSLLEFWVLIKNMPNQKLFYLIIFLFSLINNWVGMWVSSKNIRMNNTMKYRLWYRELE